jgi:hypothetical protein
MPYSTRDIQKLYLAYFNRPADPPGLQYWQQSGASLDEIAHWFSKGAEYTARFEGQDNSGIVQQIYYNLFSRDGEPAGVAYWKGLLDNGAINIGNVVTSMLDGARGSDAVAVSAKVDAMEMYCTAIEGSSQSILNAQTSSSVALARAWLSNVWDAASLDRAKAALPGMLSAEGAIPGPSLVLSGHVHGDGAISGATVFNDINHNGMPDQGEGSTVTDAYGFYLLSDRVRPAIPGKSGEPLHVDIVVKGGVDTQTGQASQAVFTYSYDTVYFPYAGAPFKEAHVDFGPQDAHFHSITLTGVAAITFE